MLGKPRQEYASYCANYPTSQGLKALQLHFHVLGGKVGFWLHTVIQRPRLLSSALPLQGFSELITGPTARK